MKASITWLIILNLAAAAVGLVLGWTTPAFFNLYWIELFTLGAVTVAQIIRAPSRGPMAKSRQYQVIFFIAHYTTFLVIYRALVAPSVFLRNEMPPLFWILVWIPVCALGAVHVASYLLDFRRYEITYVTPMRLQGLPYLRMAPVHLALIIVWFAFGRYEGLGLVIGFVAAKIVADALSHIVYHRRVIRDGDFAGQAWDPDKLS